MIEYYYFCHDECLEKLIERLNIYNYLSNNIEHENDIILIHIIHRVISNTTLYRKSDIKEYIFQHPNFSIAQQSLKSAYEELFDYCWRQKFTLIKDSPKSKMKRIRDLAYMNRPISRKLLDNNISMIAMLILYFVLCYYIDRRLISDNSWLWRVNIIDTYPIFITFLAMIFACMFSALSHDNSLKFVPFVMCSLFCILAITQLFLDTKNLIGADYYSDLSFEEIALIRLQLIKRDVILGLASFLLVPIIKLNIQRLNDMA